MLNDNKMLSGDRIEDIIQRIITERECKIIFYYGKIVDKHRENRILLDALGPILLTTLPPFYKFKRFTNEIFYNQAISRMKTSTCLSDTMNVYYDGSNSVDEHCDLFTTLFVYLPTKKCDIMIKCYNCTNKLCNVLERDSKFNNVLNTKLVLEELKRDIVECRMPKWILRCIKARNKSDTTLHEVNIEIKDVSCVKSLLFDLFEDFHYKRRNDDKLEEEKSLKEDPWI